MFRLASGLDLLSVTDLDFTDSIVVARDPAELYDLISDVTRMGEWSPVCKACW